MARLEDLKLHHRLFMRRYAYRRWREDGVEAPTLRRPLDEARVALVTTGGLHRPDQEPFDVARRGGDPSFRELGADTETARLRCAHRSDAFDHAGLERDPELAFPLSALRRLAEAGVIGEVASLHLSYMGSVTRPERLVEETAPGGARRLREAGAEAIVLVPV